jgi:hypothetical protein
MIVSAHQLVSEAIIMDKPQTDDAPSEEVEEASVEKETAKSPCHEQYPTNHEYCDQRDKSLGKVVFGLHKLDIYAIHRFEKSFFNSDGKKYH